MPLCFQPLNKLLLVRHILRQAWFRDLDRLCVILDYRLIRSTGRRHLCNSDRACDSDGLG